MSEKRIQVCLIKKYFTVDVLLCVIATSLWLSSCDPLLGKDEDTEEVAVTEVADPIFSKATGTYTTGFSLTLSCTTPGATIYYTTNGLDSDGPVTAYTTPISISTHTGLWAYAQKGDVKSKIVRADYAIIANESGNLIGNGDFSLGQSLWYTWVNTQLGAAANFSFAEKKAVITQTASGSEPWAMGIGIAAKPTIRNGKIYTIKFSASASQARTMVVKIGENSRDLNGNGGVYDSYIYKECSLTTTPQTFTFEFGMINPTDDDPDTIFYLGKYAGNVTIDDVSLTVRDPAPIDASTIPDANLRQAIADSVGVTVGSLNETHLLGIQDLDANKYGISDLTGIDTLTNLWALEIRDNSISDLSPLVGMYWMGALHLQGNDLDFSDLSIITKDNFPLLERLFMNSNDNQITDTDGVINLFLGFSSFTAIGIEDFSMTDAQFNTLYQGVIAENLGVLDGLTIWGNALGNTSLALIGNITALEWLNLDDNFNITNIVALEELKNLKDLKLDGTSIEDLTPLHTMYDAGCFRPEAESIITIRDCGLNLSPGTQNRAVVDYLLNKGVNMEWEDGNILTTPVVINLEAFSDPILRQVVEDTEATYVHELTEIGYEGNDEDGRISSLAGMEQCVALVGISLANNAISDIGPLSDLVLIRNLNLCGNDIASLNPILDFSELEYLELNNNYLPYAEIAKITPTRFPNLRRIGISRLDGVHEPLDITTSQVISILTPFTGLESILLHFPDMDPSGFSQLYQNVLTGSISTLRSLQLTNCNIGSASLSYVTNLTSVEELALAGNNIIDISDLASISTLRRIMLSNNAITDLTPLETLYNAGGLHSDGDDMAFVSIGLNGLDLSEGTDNRDVVDFLLGNGVEMDWEYQGE